MDVNSWLTLLTVGLSFSIHTPKITRLEEKLEQKLEGWIKGIGIKNVNKYY